MSMNRQARRAVAQKQTAGRTPPPLEAVQPYTETQASTGFTTLLEKATQEILAVTYWFDPEPRPGPYSVTIRFSGKRLDAQGRLTEGDRFTRDETIEHVLPGSGPVSLTARIQGIHAGKWAVTARPLQAAHPTLKPKEKPEPVLPLVNPLPPIARLWHRWAPPAESVESMHTCLTPLAHVPGIVPGIWGIMVAIGMIVALVIQTLVISAQHLALSSAWAISLGAILVGIVGAKVWYLVTYRQQHLKNGWCIQGFIAGATLAAAILLVVFNVPAGAFLDATAPDLLIAMAIGRVGCFFAGCCGGPPTASRWGIWSSDQNVGARRIPTQLLELVLALSLGLGTLVAIGRHGPANGAFFVGGLAVYTLVRQGILHLRAEARKTKFGWVVTSLVAVLALVGALLVLAR